MEKLERNSNIELLRIISIILITVSHYTVHNSINNNTLPMGFNRLLLENTTLGNIGVIIFILISGYYMISIEKPFNLKKFLILYFQVFFYSAFFYLIFILLGRENFSIKGSLHNLLPISHNAYWFMTVYFIIYIFSFYINKFINSLNRKQHYYFILMCLIIFILGTITNTLYYFNELVQLIVFYSIGAYFKKYPDNKLNNKNLNIRLLILSVIFLILSTIGIYLLASKYDVYKEYSLHFYNRTSILSIIVAIAMFNIFILKKKKSNKYINFISKYVLGVYLISDNNYVRKIIWTELLNVPKYVFSHYLIIHMFFSIIIVFIVCITFDFIRKNTIERLYMPIIKKIDRKFSKNII